MDKNKEMSNILNILNELASDNSRKFKEAVLAREQDNMLLKRVFEMALNPNINYWIKQIPEPESFKIYAADKGADRLSNAMDNLNAIIHREITGNAAYDYLATILSSLHPKDAKVIERIVSRDLRCGVSDATVNKIWKGLIPDFKVMLADKKISAIQFPAFCQTKMDGIRCHLTLNGNKVTAYSRQGKPIETLGCLDVAAMEMMRDGETWDGELVCFHQPLGQVQAMNRQQSNGILNKAIRGTIESADAELITFTAWDIVNETQDYDVRFGELQQRFQRQPSGPMCKFRLVHSVTIYSIDEAQIEFQKALELGEEGVILKNKKSKWEGKRSKHLCKLKAEESADLKVVGWNEGTGKYVGKMGSLVCQTEDGLLEVSVGTGFSDADRDTLTRENTVGRILEVQYNQLIQSKKDKKPCLYLPRAFRWREDKQIANSLAELK